MTAYDDAEANRVATADVTIVVARNAHAPRFDETDYEVTLSQAARVGEAILTVTASDEDGVSIILCVTGRMRSFVVEESTKLSLFPI